MAEYRIPEELRYSEGDEWIRLEENRRVVGVTDYAQQQLGDIVFVELPEIGRSVEKGRPCRQETKRRILTALGIPWEDRHDYFVRARPVRRLPLERAQSA